MSLRRVLLLLFGIFLSGAAPAFGQAEEPADQSRSEAPKVFLDCGACDFAYIRQEVPFVNYVRDPELAQIHVFVTNQRTGSGGQTYTLSYTGQQNFAGLEHALTYTAQQTNTWAETRSELTERLKLGLVPYMAQTPMARQMSVSFEVGEEPRVQEPLDDPWNAWVFDVEGGGSVNLESSVKAYTLQGELSANRITADWKVRTRAYTYFNERSFENEDEVITSTSERSGLNGSLVKSLSEHWSAGLFTELYSNTYRNTDFSTGLTPAVEYNYFPYEESSRKEWVFVYRVGYDFRNYIEETIYGQLEENLLAQSLQTFVRFQQPWGFVYARLTGSHYLHDFSQNSIDFYSNLSLRLLRGLSLRFSGGLEIINNQLYLPKGDATLEEILLQRRQLATGYELSGSIGLAYTFGSMYNNVVNTRL